jgi:transposase-like protein
MRYSEAFKLQVVRELETGHFENPCAAGRAYGMKGLGTVAYWVRRYGKNHLLGKVVRVMKADEQAEVKVLRQRVRELERALAERVNGILKQEYEMDQTFRTKAQAKAAFEQAVWLYNYRRPHLMLHYRFPADVHQEAA